MGMTPRSYSVMAITMGSMTWSSSCTSTGEPMLICRARAPIILALSNLVYFKVASSMGVSPKM